MINLNYKYISDLVYSVSLDCSNDQWSIAQNSYLFSVPLHSIPCNVVGPGQLVEHLDMSTRKISWESFQKVAQELSDVGFKVTGTDSGLE